MIRELLTTLQQTRRENEQLAHRLDQLLRRLYGPRAERFDPNQPLLFDDPAAIEAPASATAAAATQTESRSRHENGNGHGRQRLPENLPRIRRPHDLSAAEKLCPACGQERTRIGEEVSEQLEWQPASLFVVQHVRFKYACKCCQEQVAIAAKPAQPIDKGLPGPGLLAQVITSKYSDHLPLHRLERILARHGVELSRQTMCGWMAASAALLKPLYERMTQRVLQSPVIHTDDTPVPVLDETRQTTRQARAWVYIGNRDHRYAVFDYTPTHARDGPASFLKNYTGYLQADAFAGYDAIYTGSDGKIVEVACWAHARRKFYDARSTDPERGHAALAWIRKLYDVEDETKELSDAGRAALRQERSLPLLTSFRQWLEAQRAAVLPKSPLGQAISYALSNWDALLRYCEAGFLAIDNNLSERTLRAVAIGRKNWLFAGSDNGGKTAAVLFSFTATCRLLDIDPFTYLRDVLARLPDHPAERLADLLPDRWAEATVLQFASKLLSAASEAGLISPKRDPRALLFPKVPDLAIAYLLHLLRSVRIEGSLLENPYVASVGLGDGILDQRLKTIPSITLRRKGKLVELDWAHPTLAAWAEATL
jgi:transposase